MAEAVQATSRRTRAGDSYVSQWNRFVTWSEASGRCSLPASPADVSAYLEDRSGTGARPSTLRVVVAAIARSHRDAGFDVPLHQGVARTVLEELAGSWSLLAKCLFTVPPPRSLTPAYGLCQ